MISRAEVTSRILDAKRQKKLTFDSLAKALNRHPVWTAAACYGQASCSAEEAKTLLSALDLEEDLACVLRGRPSKGRSEQQSPRRSADLPLS